MVRGKGYGLSRGRMKEHGLKCNPKNESTSAGAGARKEMGFLWYVLLRVMSRRWSLHPSVLERTTHVLCVFRAYNITSTLFLPFVEPGLGCVLLSTATFPHTVLVLQPSTCYL